MDGLPPGPWLGQQMLVSWPMKQHVAAQQRYHFVNDGGANIEITVATLQFNIICVSLGVPLVHHLLLAKSILK